MHLVHAKYISYISNWWALEYNKEKYDTPPIGVLDLLLGDVANLPNTRLIAYNQNYSDASL